MKYCSNSFQKQIRTSKLVQKGKKKFFNINKFNTTQKCQKVKKALSPLSTTVHHIFENFIYKTFLITNYHPSNAVPLNSALTSSWHVWPLKAVFVQSQEKSWYFSKQSPPCLQGRLLQAPLQPLKLTP